MGILTVYRLHLIALGDDHVSRSSTTAAAGAAGARRDKGPRANHGIAGVRESSVRSMTIGPGALI